MAFCEAFSVSVVSFIHHLVPPIPLLLLVQHGLNIAHTLALLPSTTLWRKTRRNRHLLCTLCPQLIQASLLLDIRNPPLLEVLDPSSCTVPLKIRRLNWTSLLCR